MSAFSRFHSFLLFLGYSKTMARDTKAEDFCRTVSNFSLEYRTTRQAILLQRERERQRSGAESPGPNTPAARRKHQQTPSQVFTSYALNVRSVLDKMIDWICEPAICRSTRNVKSNVSWRRCWKRLSPPHDWTSRCLGTAGGWQTSQVLYTPFSLFIHPSCVLLKPMFVYFSGSLSRKLTWWPCWYTVKTHSVTGVLQED